MAEAGLTFAGVYLFLAWNGFVSATSITVAAIAVSTSPTVVMRVVSENNARGQLTQRLLLFPEHFGSAGAMLVILLFVLTALALHRAGEASPTPAPETV